MMRRIFVGWYAVGLLLMATIGVPAWLGFSNGLFLLFYALYAVDLEWRIGEVRPKWQTGRIVTAAALTFIAEWIGVHTGWPFGDYSYTSVLGWGLGGVPLAIACAWVGVLLNALLLTRGHSLWFRALQAGGWTVLLDLVLDPVALQRGFWIWEHTDGYYGVPIVNFAAWFVLSAGLSLLFPIRQIPFAIRREASLLMQLMLLMFGILALKAGLILPALIAAGGIGLVEGVLRYDRRG